MIGRFHADVVDHKAEPITIKGAIDKLVVAAVIDAAVAILAALHVGEGVILAEMRDVDAGAAVEDMAIADRHRRADIIAGIHTGDAAAVKAADPAAPKIPRQSRYRWKGWQIHSSARPHRH